jgi:4-amino-4-deoxy-L-arabinose transferase-like glycosyltransferase
MSTSESSDNSPIRPRHRDFSGLFAGLLLLGMAVLAGGAAWRESVTIDEVAHIGAGVTYLQKFDLRFNPEHPPLPKILAALPLVLRGIHADYSHPSWTNAQQFFPAFLGEWVFGDWLLNKWNDPATTLAWARLPMLVLTLLLGWILFIYARRLGGPWGGLLCLSVYVGTPTFLTFGPLVLTDLAVTLFTLLTVWRLADLWHEPGKKNTFWFALSFAGALLSKFTAGILLFVFAVMALSTRWRHLPGQPAAKPDARVWRKPRRRATLWGILWAALAVYAFYLVFSWNQPTGILERIGHGPGALLLRRLLMPPLLYLGGAAFVLIGGSRPTFLLGHAYSHGVWFYFPIVFLLKSPLGFLALLALAVLVALGSKRRVQLMKPAVPLEFPSHWRALWVSLIVFTFFCLLSRLTISIRHFTVPMVLLILLLAPLPRMLGQLLASAPVTARLLTGLTALLAASCLFSALRAYPYYFPYVNALSFGRPLYFLMSDSNVDWDQSLPEVKRFADQHGLPRIGLDAYSISDVTVTVPQSEFWDCQKPTASDEGQWVAVSTNMIQDSHNCLWLMQYPQESLGGGSMYAVHLPEHIPPAGSPGGPPLPATFRVFAGAPFDVRVFFLYYIHHPEKLPRTNEEAQATFSPENRAKIENPSQFKAK